jgi:hypothetical protein
VGAYGFDAGSGIVAEDTSGNGNAGEISGASWTTGRFGKAVRFDGDGEVVRVPASRSLDLSRAMTLSAWIKPSEAQLGWRTILHRQTDAYFLDAGGARLRENRLGTFDDGRVLLIVLTAILLCGALALDRSAWDGGRRGSWWLPIGLFLGGSIVDAAFAPAGTLIAPTLVATWFAATARDRVRAAIGYVVAAGFAAVTVVALAGPDDSRLANDGDATARSVSLGLLLVILGLLSARRDSARVGSAPARSRLDPPGAH